MTITTANIDIGDLPNDGTGDPLRTAFEKINENFAELVNALPEGPEGSFQFNSAGTSLGTANFAYVEGTNIINIGANLVPIANISIGTTGNRIANLFVGNTALKIGNISVEESSNTISFPITVLPTSKASFAVNNLTADGNGVFAGSVTVGNTIHATFTATTSNNDTNQVLFQTSVVGFRSGMFYITSRESGGNNSQTATVSVIKNTNNNTANYSVYGTIFQGEAITNYNADVGYSNVRFMVSPFNNATVTHTVTYQITP